MQKHQYKKIGSKPVVKPVSKLDIMKSAWADVKPFVKFSFKAMQVVAHALIFIVKHIPKPEEPSTRRKGTQVIKVKK